MELRKPTDSEIAILESMNSKLMDARNQLANMDAMFMAAFESLRQECGASAEHRFDQQKKEFVLPEQPTAPEQLEE